MYSYTTAGDFGIGPEDAEENLDVFGNGGDTCDDLSMGQLTVREAERIDDAQGAMQGIGQYVQQTPKPLAFSDPGRFAGIYSNMLTTRDLLKANEGMRRAKKRMTGMSGDAALDWDKIVKSGLEAQGLGQGVFSRAKSWLAALSTAGKIGVAAGAVATALLVAMYLKRK